MAVETKLASIDYLRMIESATPSAPGGVFGLIYIKSDGLLYSMDAAGLETSASNSGNIILAPASSTRNIIEPTTGDYIPLTVRGYASAQTAKILVAQEGSADTEVFSLSGTGAATFQNFTDSTTGFQILDKDGGTALLTADTTNERIGIGIAPGYNFHVQKTNVTATEYSNYIKSVYNPSGVENSPSNTSLFVSAETAGATIPTGSPFLGAFEVYANHNGAGNLANLRGAYASVDNNSAGTITNGYSAYLGGVWNWGAGSVTNGYQLYIYDQEGATNNYSIYTNVGNIVFNAANGAGNITFGATPVSANYDLMLAGDGVLGLKETTTPTADTNYGKIYTKSVNQLFFQDGGGTEHLLHGPAYSSIWFNGDTTVVTIATTNTMTKIDTFENVGTEDDQSLATGSAATNDITLSATIGAGNYNIAHSSSVTIAGGAAKIAMIVPGITLATPKTITDVTDNTISPIVITTAGHGLLNGDMVTIVSVAGNTAANGDFRVDNVTSDTFEIIELDDVATTGNGDYNEGSPTGSVTIVYPGGVASQRVVSGADLGVIANSCLIPFVNGDSVGLYVANIVDANNLNVRSVNLTMAREDI